MQHVVELSQSIHGSERIRLVDYSAVPARILVQEAEVSIDTMFENLAPGVPPSALPSMKSRFSFSKMLIWLFSDMLMCSINNTKSNRKQYPWTVSSHIQLANAFYKSKVEDGIFIVEDSATNRYFVIVKSSFHVLVVWFSLYQLIQLLMILCQRSSRS